MRHHQEQRSVSVVAAAASLMLVSLGHLAAGQLLQKNATIESPPPTSVHRRHHHHHHFSAQQPQQQQARAGELDSESTPASLSSSMLRAYIRTNSMRAYHLDLHSYRPDAKFIGDPNFVDSTSAEHLQRCRRHLNHYNDLLRAYMQTDPTEMVNSMDALRLADTFGRPDAGLIDGHQFWLGAYERCLEVSVRVPPTLQATKGEPVRSHYCLGLAQFPSWKPEDTKTSVKIGLCLPETCTSSMLNEAEDLFALVEQMMRYQLGGPLEKLRLRSVYCLPHETSPVRQVTLSGKLLVGVVALLVLVCLYATIHDYLNRKTLAAPASEALVVATAEQQKSSATVGGKTESRPAELRNWRTICVESFSLIRNFELIFAREPKRNIPLIVGAGEQADAMGRFNRDVFFNCITGIKCIGLIWIIGAHTFLVSPITHKNLIHLDQLTQTYLANLYLAAHLMVDSFFALSGLLAAYLLFKSQSLAKMRLSQWLVHTIHRYWRLTPVYLLCFWFAKSLGHLVNAGPLWDYSTAAQSPRLNCANESWWEAILYLSDFKSPKNHCVPFAWFIANGIKFWMVTPVFVTLIHKSTRRGYAIVTGAILLNIALVVRLAISSNVDMKSVIEFKPESADNMLNNMEEVYTRPYSRIGAYLVGLMAGHMIYQVESQGQPVRMSEKMKILTWSLVSATAIVLTFVVKIAGGVELEESAIPWVFSFSSALIRPLWALCTCWLVFALAHGQARFLAKFLSANLWRQLAKLSFCAYLTQGEVMANLYLSYTHSSPYTYSEMVTRPIVATCVTIALSLLMALVVEYPLIGIEELILPRRHKSSAAGETVGKSSAGEPLDEARATTGEEEAGRANGLSSENSKVGEQKLKEL